MERRRRKSRPRPEPAAACRCPSGSCALIAFCSQIATRIFAARRYLARVEPGAGHARAEVHRDPRCARAQPEVDRRRHPARPAGGDHRALRLGQVEPRLRHHLCRGAAALCREPVGLCPAVPRHDAEAGRRPYLRPSRRRSRSSRRPPRRTRARPSAPSPRSTTTCGCCSRGSARPTRPATGLPIEAQQISQMVDITMALPEGTRAYLLAPIVRDRKGEYRKEFADLRKQGFQRVKVNGEFHDLDAPPELDKKYRHDIDVVVDRIVVREGLETRLADSLRTALDLADGIAMLETAPTAERGRRRARSRSGSPSRRSFACPVCGLHHPRDRAAAVLVQRAVRRLPGLRRARGRAVLRPAADRAGRGADADARRDRAVGQGAVALLPADDRGAGAHYEFDKSKKWRDLPEQAQQVLLYGSEGEKIQLPLRRGRPGLRDQPAVRGGDPQHGAALPRDRLGLGRARSSSATRTTGPAAPATASG